ncbi:C40 family peptidase [Butyrivibrio sp. M55]|uniref:C40 family peptidase n=1 Tax=Butyrivibrio sp. M55 TaxID=1855323 RepID=UPI0008F39014|nr:C40 family peptidase [Butyrivibrio sp. M55]SFU95820.1 NlpC/P60 family protein [Butyrivibrio sp. M55]
MDDERKKNSEDKNSGVQSIEAGLSVAHVYAEKLEKYNYKKKQRARKLHKHMAEDRAVQKSESNPQSKARQRAQIKKETQRKVQNRSSKEAANQFGDISRKFVDKAEDLTGKFAEYLAEHFEEWSVVFVVLVLILVIGALFSSCGSALTGTSHVGVATSYTSDDDDIYAVEDDYREMEEALQEIIDNVEDVHPGYDEYQYYLDNIGHNPYQLAAVLTVLYEQYKGSVVRATLTEIFERQYYLSFNSVTETRTDDDTGIQYEYKILKVTLVNRTLDNVIRGLGLSADQMARYEVLLETYGNKRYLFEDDIYSIVEPGRYGEYDVPPEALTNTRFSNMIREAEKYLGYPYVWGGSKPSTSFDCSGFVCWVINHSNNGWNVGRTTANGLLGRCTRVSASEAQPGDLIFFKGTYDVKGASHVGIYVGDGMMLHCGNPIQYTSINSNYWRKHFYTYGRINA